MQKRGMSRKSEVHSAQIISHMQRSVKRVPRREALVLFQPWRKANKQEVERLCAAFLPTEEPAKSNMKPPINFLAATLQC
jgi:hypothetical protein